MIDKCFLCGEPLVSQELLVCYDHAKCDGDNPRNPTPEEIESFILNDAHIDTLMVKVITRLYGNTNPEAELKRCQFIKCIENGRLAAIVDNRKGYKEYMDTGWCELCNAETNQIFHDDGHERDSSGDYRKCLKCGGTWSGLTGKWTKG